jgi:hypothetical protein
VRGKRLGKAPFGRFSVMRPTFPSTPAGAAMMYSFPCAVEVVDSVRPDTTALHSAPRPSPTTRPILRAAITNVLKLCLHWQQARTVLIRYSAQGGSQCTWPNIFICIRTVATSQHTTVNICIQ